LIEFSFRDCMVIEDKYPPIQITEQNHSSILQYSQGKNRRTEVNTMGKTLTYGCEAIL